MTINKKFLSSTTAVTSFAIGLILAVTGSVFASSIGTDLSVSGTATITSTLAVTGASTLTGLGTFTNGYVSQASSTVVGTFTVNGGLSSFNSGFISAASSTVVGNLTLTGISSATSTWLSSGFISNASSTIVGAFTVGQTNATALTGTLTVTGATTLSSTLDVTSLATLTAGYVSQASSTVVGNLSVGGTGGLSVGTSTPGKTLSINGDVFINSTSTTATTTVTISSGGPSGTTIGGCINLRATDGTMIRIYATTTPTAVDSGSTNAKSTGFKNLVVEAGSCQAGGTQ